jgi:RNA polymerase sigma-70 factor, ECF subfamily
VTEEEQKLIFGQWLRQYKALIFKIVRAYAFTAMDQDDLFQEITIQVWRSIPTFRNASAVSTWIYRVSLNTTFSWIRKERRRPDARESLENVHHVLEETDRVIDERLTWLYDEIYKLDAIDRSLTLLMLDGLSYKEMATIVGITETNVGVKINRIKKQLIGELKKYNSHGI